MQLEEKGIPFFMELGTRPYKAEATVRTVREMSKTAETNGIVDRTLDEINVKINAARNEDQNGMIHSGPSD